MSVGPPAPHTQSLWQPPEPPPAPSRREQQRERVREAAAFCVDTLSSSWQEAVADRATDYAQTAWQRLTSIPGKLAERGSNAPAVALTRAKTLGFNESS